MTGEELMDLELGSKIEYSIFKDVTYDGMDNEHVIMRDKNGDQKRVYTDLFLKYGKVLILNK